MLPNTHNPSYSQPSLKATPSSSLPCVNPKCPTHPPAPPHTLHNFASLAQFDQTVFSKISHTAKPLCSGLCPCGKNGGPRKAPCPALEKLSVWGRKNQTQTPPALWA